MKTFFTRILSTALCFILAFAVIQPAFAEGTDDFVDYDAPYIAFTADKSRRRHKRRGDRSRQTARIRCL